MRRSWLVLPCMSHQKDFHRVFSDPDQANADTENSLAGQIQLNFSWWGQTIYHRSLQQARRHKQDLSIFISATARWRLLAGGIDNPPSAHKTCLWLYVYIVWKADSQYNFQFHHRRRPKGDSGWRGLPQDLLEVIVIKFWNESDLPAYLELQLVCKSWRAAVRNAPTKSVCVDLLGPSSDLRVCRVLPGMSSLEINSHGRAYDLSPVSRLSRLTDLILVNSRSHNEGSLEIDLRSLPASLRVLVIRGRGLRTTGLQHLMFVNLTHLTCDFDTIRDAFDLLQDLPLLRVSPPACPIESCLLSDLFQKPG